MWLRKVLSSALPMYQKPHRCLDQTRSYYTIKKKKKKMYLQCKRTHLRWRTQSKSQTFFRAQTLLGTRKSAVVGTWEMVWPESCLYRTVSITPVRNLTNALSFWKTSVQAHVWSPTRGFIQVGNLQVQWMWESCLAMLTSPHSKRIQIRGWYIFNALWNSASDSMHASLDVRKPHWKETPTVVRKAS